MEFYELHTSRDCTEINSGSNIHLVRYCGVLEPILEVMTPSFPSCRPMGPGVGALDGE